MADKSKIEWTEATWNPITGCSVTSPGCTNCYAMRLAGTRLKHHPSREGLTKEVNGNHVWTGEVRFNEQWLDQPLRWKRPRMIFVCAHADLFHESVPDEWIDKVFAVMAMAPQHTFQVLTKRSDRMRKYLDGFASWVRVENLLEELRPSALWNGNKFMARSVLSNAQPLPNVWLGVSVETKNRDWRLDDLEATPAAMHWVSYEPALGAVDFRPWLADSVLDETGGLDWIVAGGESGPKARPCHPDWIRSVRDQCAAAGVPFFFKQWGEWLPGENYNAPSARWQDGNTGIHPIAERHPDRENDYHHFGTVGEWGAFAIRVGKKAAGRTLDGETHDAYPRKDEADAI